MNIVALDILVFLFHHQASQHHNIYDFCTFDEDQACILF